MSQASYKPPKFGANPVLLGLGAILTAFAIGILLPLTQLLNPSDGKKKIRSVEDLNQALKQVLNSNQKTILLVIYNSQNQKRYIGVKLD